MYKKTMVLLLNMGECQSCVELVEFNSGKKLETHFLTQHISRPKAAESHWPIFSNAQVAHTPSREGLEAIEETGFKISPTR